MSTLVVSPETMRKMEYIEKANRQKIVKFLQKNNITLIEVVDAVIEADGIIGVGLITLGDQLKTFCRNKIR